MLSASPSLVPSSGLPPPYIEGLQIREIFEGENFCETTSMKISRRKLSRVQSIELRACDVREENFRKNCLIPLYNWKWSSPRTRTRTSCRPCDSFNQLAKKLVARLVASLERTPGKRHLVLNRLPLWSTCGQSRVPIVLLSSPSGRHW